MPTPAQVRKAKDQAWRQGFLTWKLRKVGCQRPMYAGMTSNAALKYVLNCSRRLGKSFELCLLAIETAIKVPGAQIRFAAPTQKMLQKIIRPLFRTICLDAPKEVRPTWRLQDSMYVFPNGSEIHVSGANNGHDENLRGTAAHLCLVDEAGFIKDLKYLVEDILMPQLLTTNGRLVMASSPPRTPAHEFAAYAQAAMMSGNYAEYDIYQSGYSNDVIQRFKEEAGGDESTTWQREYLCKFVVDSDFAIIPEWKQIYAQEWPKDEFFPFYHLYEGMDMGVTDLTVVLFGYYDFKAAKIIVEDELSMHGPRMTTDLLAKAIREKEIKLWGKRAIYRRIADNNNPLLLQDLASMHGISFAPVTKNAQGIAEPVVQILNAMVNEVRMMVSAGRLIVHPRCKQLLGCLQYGVFEETKRQFARSAVYGHYDALAALIYMLRNVNQVTNPIPAMYGLDKATHHIPKNFGQQQNEKALKQIFGLRR